ncbi:MAG: extracellular solute-binding protein, partial [Castellaniella sp.]|nr:extracellular solute-binding protein [Castellaniella sp.]
MASAFSRMTILAALITSTGLAHAATDITFWHSMEGPLGERVDAIAQAFNKSQSDYVVHAVYKGAYAESMNAGIAAFRAGNAPDILQVFEVGTGTMMSAKGAIKPVHEMMKEAGEKFDPNAYLPAITGYYSTAKGEMLSMPFNSSSMVMWYNKDAFKKAGLDPEKPPKTWPETFEAAKKLKAAGYDKCGVSNAWATWANIEQFGAWHNIALSTKVNGMAGFDA